jgi:hypothetical protein
MMKTRNLVLTLIASAALGMLLLAPAGTARAAGVEDLLPVGTAAPPFQAVDINGQPYSLEEDLSKGAVFLIFWSIF